MFERERQRGRESPAIWGVTGGMSVLYCWRHCFNESHVEPQQCVWLTADTAVCSLSFLSCLRGHGHKQAFISVPFPHREFSSHFNYTEEFSSKIGPLLMRRCQRRSKTQMLLWWSLDPNRQCRNFSEVQIKSDSPGRQRSNVCRISGFAQRWCLTKVGHFWRIFPGKLHCSEGLLLTEFICNLCLWRFRYIVKLYGQY